MSLFLPLEEKKKRKKKKSIKCLTLISGPSKSDIEHIVNSISAWMCPSYSPWGKSFCCCRPSEIQPVNWGGRVLDSNKASDMFLAALQAWVQLSAVMEEWSSCQGSAGLRGLVPVCVVDKKTIACGHRYYNCCPWILKKRFKKKKKCVNFFEWSVIWKLSSIMK